MELANAITKLPELVEETLKLNDSIKAIAEKYKDALFDKIISNIREIKARGGKVIARQECGPAQEPRQKRDRGIN